MIKRFKVTGMHCSACEMLVADSLLDLDGVKTVNASHKEQYVEVDFDNKIATDSQIVSIINDEGYKVE